MDKPKKIGLSHFILAGLLVMMFSMCSKPQEVTSKIVFVSDRDGNREIYTMNPDGSDQQNITSHPANDFSPTWSPDGSRIAFKSTRDNPDNPDIYLMNADGSNVIRITENISSDFSLSWSPAGNQIAWTYFDPEDRSHEIGVINIDGSGKRVITHNPGKENHTPSWSPKGDKIIFISNRNGKFEVYEMNPDGSNQNQLTNLDLTNGTFPVMSPQERKIIVRAIKDGNSDLYLISETGTATRLTTHEGADWGGSWSQDGKSLVFNSDRDGDFEIYKIDIIGGSITQLTNNEFRDFVPDWY